MSFWTVTLTLLEGLVNTGRLFLLTLLFALPLGLLLCFGAMSRFAPLASLGRRLSGPWGTWLTRFRPISLLVKLVVWIVRGSPLMLQILIVYYGPGLLWGVPLLPRFTAALVTFAVNYACYFSEIYRGGIQSIPRGQYEAGQVLGMTRSQVFFRVVLLQVVKRITPPMSNEVITLVKDTALARVVSVAEIIMCAERYTKQGLIWPLFSTGLFFLLFNGVLTLLFGYFEKKMDYFKG